jgi:hypothetical protein
MQHTIVEQLFEEFLKAIETAGSVDPSVAKRLRGSLLERGELRADELRTVLFSEEELP